MLRGVTVAREALPRVAATRLGAANVHDTATHQATVGGRHLRHHAGIEAGTGANLRQGLRIGEPVRSHERSGCFTAHRGVGAAAQARRGKVGGAHPQAALEAGVDLRGGAAPALCQPVRQADMVRVHVRHQHAQHRQAIKLSGHHLFPGGAGGVVGNAAIDRRPALQRAVGAFDLIAQQPQVDVVQGKGQRHAQPAHARRHRHGVAQGGQRVGPGVVRFLPKLVRIGNRWVHGVESGDSRSIDSRLSSVVNL